MGALGPISRRSVQMSYREAPIDIKVASVADECDLRVAAVLKARAVQTGAIKPFWVEQELLDGLKVGADKAGPKKKVAASLVGFMAVPRQRATALFEEHGEMDSSEVARLLGSKEQWLLSMGNTFMVEIAFLSSMLGSGGESVLQRMVLRTMPDTSTATIAFTPNGAYQKLSALSESKLAKFCSKGAPGQLAACRELVSSLVQGRAPNVDKAIASGGFLQTFIGLMGNWCRFQPKKPNNKPTPPMLFGRDACQAKYDMVKSAASLKKLTLKEVEPLHVYQWLLLPMQRSEVERWTIEIVGAGKGLKKAAASSETTNASAPKAKRSKTAAADADVNNLFR